MNEVPNIISTKDLDYIKDMLNWNFVLVKKTSYYLNNVNNGESKKLLEKIIKVHTLQYEKIMNILN